MHQREMLVGSLLVLLSIITTTESAADPRTLVCRGTTSSTYNPPLTNTPTLTTLNLTNSLSECADTTGQNIISGLNQVAFTLSKSCGSPEAPLAADFAFSWTTTSSAQKSSVIKFPQGFNARNILGQTLVVGEGQIVEGNLKWYNATFIGLYTTLNVLDCANGGVTGVTGMIMVIIGENNVKWALP